MSQCWFQKKDCEFVAMLILKLRLRVAMSQSWFQKKYCEFVALSQCYYSGRCRPMVQNRFYMSLFRTDVWEDLICAVQNTICLLCTATSISGATQSSTAG